MTLASESKRLARLLTNHKLRVVFAESCTAGLVSAELGKIAGISEYLCGSAVTYRLDSKHRWLGVDAALLKRPGPVSNVVARQMAAGILAKTPEADWSASVTGHLGPNAPKRLDGVVYVGIAGRRCGNATARRHSLQSESRGTRQREAAELVLEQLRLAIEASIDG